MRQSGFISWTSWSVQVRLCPPLPHLLSLLAQVWDNSWVRWPLGIPGESRTDEGADGWCMGPRTMSSRSLVGPRQSCGCSRACVTHVVVSCCHGIGACKYRALLLQSLPIPFPPPVLGSGPRRSVVRMTISERILERYWPLNVGHRWRCFPWLDLRELGPYRNE